MKQRWLGGVLQPSGDLDVSRGETKKEIDDLGLRINLLSDSIEDLRSSAADLCSRIAELEKQIRSSVSLNRTINSSIESIDLCSPIPKINKPNPNSIFHHIPQPKSGQQISAFSGMAHPLSNLYSCAVIHEKRRYSSSEQAIQFAKAELYGDQPSAMKILSCHNPLQCLHLGKSVVGFKSNPSLWYNNAKKIIQKITFSKFQIPHLKIALLATEDRYLAESTLGDYWGIGLSHKSPDLENPKKWTGRNGFGEILMSTRETLQKKF